MTMAKRKKPADLALDVWIRLGGGPTGSEAQEMTEGERLVQEANEVLLELLQSSTMRTSPVNPFRRDR
jgi:hypothetical protein